jgi:hypothetical protein
MPDAFRSGWRLPDAPLPGSSGNEIRATERLDPGGNSAAAEKKDTIIRMALKPSRDQLSRVVKKVFTPKKV